MRTPLPHQQEAIDRLVKQGGRGLLCDEMGLGKSSVALWVMRELGVLPIFVICPLSVTHKWVNEIQETLGWGLTEVVLLHKQKHSLPTIIRDVGPSAIVLNYERLTAEHKAGRLIGLQTGVHLVGLQTGVRAGLIVDECHYAKSRISLRSKAVRALAQRCHHVLCLTGTLVRNDVRDVWHPAELAVPGHLGSYAMFEAKYCNFRMFKMPHMRRAQPQFQSAKNEHQLAAKLAEVMVRRKKVDVVDLPPKQRVVIPLDLDKESARIYREMKQRAMVELREVGLATLGDMTLHEPDRHVIARTALEQAIRLEQITNGIVGGSNLERPEQIISSAKIEWVLETFFDLRDQGRSLAIFAKFNETLMAIWHRVGATINGVPHEVKPMFGGGGFVGYHPPMLTGDTKPEWRQKVIDSFRSGENPILLCQLRLAEGFDLTPCTDAIFLGIDWTPAMMDQAEDRLHRIGTTGQVTCYYPLMRKTIDERLYRVVMEKREDARRVVGDVAVMREELQIA